MIKLYITSLLLYICIHTYIRMYLEYKSCRMCMCVCTYVCVRMYDVCVYVHTYVPIVLLACSQFYLIFALHKYIIIIMY